MQYVYASLLALGCAVACVRPVWAVALLLCIFPIEQVLQSVSPFLRTSVLGNQLVNYLLGLVAILAAGNTALRKPITWLGYPNPTLLVITVLLAWSAVTVLWSPGRELGMAVLASRWPYFVVMVLLGSYIICDLDDVRELVTALAVLGVVLCTIILVSPEFGSQWGRLGILEGGKLQSNPLAIGELGGATLLVGALMRRTTLGVLGLPLRIAAVLLGTVVAIKSGSRGQFFFAVALSIAFFPVAAPVRSVTAFLSTAVGMAVIGGIVAFLASTLLEGFAARRFSTEQLIYGSSSTLERFSNVMGLAGRWISNPLAIAVGLGYYAYSSFGYGAEYSHVVAADVLFELGIPGALLYIAMIALMVRASRGLMRVAGSDPVERSAAALLLALMAFQFLLSNKQGELWGVTSLFMLACIVTRLEIRYSRWPSDDEAAVTA
ncbi:MAG: O-antigen ligase family protein [Phycisphaerales bacterium]|nr:O-antigen ligase family protein [Phycisphaerales bacterium]